MSLIYSAYPDIADSLPAIPDINKLPTFPRAVYEVTAFWERLEQTIAEQETAWGLNLNPVFQREHVWTPQQQTAYVEYVLLGGELSQVLIFAVDSWSGGNTHAAQSRYELVDGKQRLEAVRGFMRGDVYAFRHKYADFKGHLRLYHRFQWRVVEVPEPEGVLKLYLSLNAGGTPHRGEELERVRGLLKHATNH